MRKDVRPYIVCGEGYPVAKVEIVDMRFSVGEGYRLLECTLRVRIQDSVELQNAGICHGHIRKCGVPDGNTAGAFLDVGSWGKQVRVDIGH